MSESVISWHTLGLFFRCRLELSPLVPRKGLCLWLSWLKNLPTMWETWVQYLGWEDPLGKGKGTNSNILAWRIPVYTAHGVTKSWTQLSDFHFHLEKVCFSFPNVFCFPD